MQPTSETQLAVQDRTWGPHPGRLFLLWVAAGLLLVGLIGTAPLARSQEARVLETAREMLGKEWRDWLIPHINGQVRLHKPPLAYWLSAACFKVFGVSEWAGRLPMALSAWLTVGLTYLLARRHFNVRAGILAAAGLCGCFLFYRFGRLAETDILATFFATAAVWALWQAADTRGGAARAWHQLSAVAIALCILAKGPPAAFPVLFLLALAWASGKWRLLLDWTLSGAPLLLAAIALPWFLFVRQTPEWAVIGRELDEIVVGIGHRQPPWFYLPLLLTTPLPWTGFLVLAVIAAAQRWRSDRRLRLLLLWGLVILLPLSIVGQKQIHYLLPLMPPLMILLGWALDRALDGSDPPLSRAVQWILGGTVIAGLLASTTPVAATLLTGRRVGPLELAVAVLLATLMAVPFLLYRRRGLPSALIYTILAGTLWMALLLGLWAPRLERPSYVEVARQIDARFAPAPYAFYGSEELELCFVMRRIIPSYAKPEELARALARQDGLVVITKSSKPRPLPPGLEEQASFNVDKGQLRLYRAKSAL